MNRKVLKRIGIAVGTLAVAGPLVSFAVSAFFWSQRADYGWSPNLATATFTDHHPVVVFDHAHGNTSTIDYPGRYWPFAKLMRADGYDVRALTQALSPQALSDADVLVIVNASGATTPQAFGINLPQLEDSKRSRSDPAFTSREIEVVRDWVRNGGSLLLIADHAPMGAASAGMAAAFGVTMYTGFVEVPDEVSDPLLFSRENGRLGNHPIIDGIYPDSRIARIMTFTGQSLRGPDDASILLKLPEHAIEYIPTGIQGRFDSLDAGPAQGLAADYGQGRVVVLGEAAMLTAQVYNREPFGMNQPGNDNKQFALNVLHWLIGSRGSVARRAGHLSESSTR